ncbi:MAG: hypothetical protein LBG87_09735 [Spirochaetaceae bacterium]|nr:hypothetical protein [Spirochaetaceae bacterium]
MTPGRAGGRAGRSGKRLASEELERLRTKINDKDYLCEAIDCLAVILSNELLNIPQGGAYSEWEGGK